MPLFDLNRRPTRRQLRQFGLACLFALPLVGWLWGGGWLTVGVLAAVGILLAALGAVRPVGLTPVFIGLSILTIPIGWLVGELVMLLVFIGLFTPLGLVFRLVGRDALELKRDRSASTYWRLKRQPENSARYYRQS